ncbi:MAG: amidohydrolase family protein [Saprospiraceae bacterium]|nr:amidohydrolase family protein [Saprospiraceae bacterium]
MPRLFTLLLMALPFLAFSQDLTYLHCGHLIDANTFERQAEMTVVVEGGNIKEVLKGYQKAPANASVIDLKNKTVLPGLMDMHVHIEFETNPDRYLQRFTLNDADVAYQAAVFAERLLMAGFTTVRDLGGSGVNVSLQRAIDRGFTKGPKLYTACKSIAVTGGHADPTNGARQGIYDYPGPEVGVADGPEECRKAVRQQVKNGADMIKITATGGVLSVARDGYRPAFTLEEIQAIVETANDFGIHVAAHAHGDEGMRRAVEGGVTSIEHGTLMSEETMDLMVKKGTWYVPTITAGKAVADSALIPNYYPEVVVPKALAIGPKIQSTFEKAYKKGVKIAFGTDSGVFAHGKNALEFQYMVEAGMPPAEAIKSATVNSAELLGISEKVGTISAGKLADIIAVSGNPLDDVTTLQDVKFVMRKGVVYKNQN